MQVYKAFFKIILKNIGYISIYVIVFLSLTISLANTNNQAVKTDFSETKVNIAFMNDDPDSKLTEGLKDFLGSNTNIVDISDEKERLQDALFFRRVEYIARVPQGFGEGMLSGREMKVGKMVISGSTSEVYLDSLINKYMNTAKIYINNLENLSEEELLGYLKEDLSHKTKVRLDSVVDASSVNERRAYYFNYMAYSLYAILILGVCSVMMVFNNTDIKRRNLCSPVNQRSMNLQLVLAILTYAVAVWVILISASLVMYRGYMFTAKGLLLLLNSFIFTLVALSVSYLIGSILRSKGAMSAVANVVALGSSFISGVFVPQAFLGERVLKIASFTPNYWYVKSNNSITEMVEVNMENLAPILLNMAVVLGFAAAILSVTMIYIKQKRMSE